MNRRAFIKSALIGLALSSGLARASLRVVDEPGENAEHVEFSLDIQPWKGGGIVYGWHTDGYYTKVLKI